MTIANFMDYLTLPYMGLLSDRQTWGGHYGPPYFFSETIYIVWSFGVYIHVYTHKPCLHGKISDFTDFPLRRYDVIFGQNDVILAKVGSIKKGHSFCKNGRVDLKIGQNTSFVA